MHRRNAEQISCIADGNLRSGKVFQAIGELVQKNLPRNGGKAVRTVLENVAHKSHNVKNGDLQQAIKSYDEIGLEMIPIFICPSHLGLFFARPRIYMLVQDMISSFAF